MSDTSAFLTSGVYAPGQFTDRVLFCTGGAGSICSAQVKALVYLGANACIIGRKEDKTLRVAKEIAAVRPGAKVIGIGNVDVRSVQSLEDAASRCVNELGGIDYVIAGAAGNFLASFTNLSANAFKSVIDIDLLGSFNTIKACLPALKASADKGKTSPGGAPRGRIIFVSATIHYTSLPLQTHVSAAKAGVDALSSSLAIELGPRGINSNVIAPGPIKGTEGMSRLAPEELIEYSERMVPVQRWGTVREIADATVFLFSNAANFINGSVMVVDGAAWRTKGGSPGDAFAYPDFLLEESVVEGVKGTKEENSKSKSKL